MDATLKKRVMNVVATIPANKVMYFGQIALACGTSARVVGWILSGLSDEECAAIPWYRVVAKNGYISSLKLGYKGVVQREKLMLEGYSVVGDTVDMSIHLWV